MKKTLIALLCALLVLCAGVALAEGTTHTDEEVQAMVAEELKLAREVAFYPAAF